MSQVLQAATKALATYLQPFLNDIPIISLQSSFEIDVKYPSICILPLRHEFIPTQQADTDTSNPNYLLARFGFMEGRTAIRVYSEGPDERAVIEQIILEAFMQTEGAPGVVVVSIPPINYGGIKWTAQNSAAFELDDAQWREELVFTSKRFSFLEIDSQQQLFASLPMSNMNTINVFLEDMQNNIWKELVIT